MATSYPLELRQKAVAAVDHGDQKLPVSQMLGISRNTLDQWLDRRAETGSLAPKHRSRLGPDPKIPDLETFRRFAAQRGHLTQPQMADEWPVSVSNRTIGKAPNAIGYTRKSDATPRRFTALGDAPPDNDRWVPRT